MDPQAKKMFFFAPILTSDDGIQIYCTSDVINVLREVARDTYTALDESVQYWFFLFPSPPAMLFFHLSSDQR